MNGVVGINVNDKLPDYNLCKLFEKKPIDPDVLRDEKEDIRWLRIKRYQLLLLLNKKVKFKGTITFFDPNTMFHTPRALLGNVTVNKNIEATHLWIESSLLKNFCLYDKIQCKGEVYIYNKNENFVALSIKDIVTMRRLIL